MRQWIPHLAFLFFLAFGRPACAQFTAGTVASYAGHSLATGGVTYTFPTNDYVFSGTGVGPIPAGAIEMRPDPNGVNTILFSCTNWSLTAPNQNININVYFQVIGANIQGGWQHSAIVTGDGGVSESTTVESTPPAISTSFQTTTKGVDLPPAVWFASGVVNVVVSFNLSSGTHGTASLKSYGTHFGLHQPQLSIKLNVNRTAQIGFSAPAGLIVTLESSPDLSNWSPLATLLNTNSMDVMTNYFDPLNSNQPAEFYRLELP